MTTKKTVKPAAAPKPAAAASVEPLEAVVAAGKETVETVVKAGTDAAQQSVDKAVAMGTEQVAAAVKAGTEVFKSYEDVVGFGKANIEAMMAANAELMKGLQLINTELFDIAKAAMEKNAKVTKQMMACTTPEDLFAMQSELAKAGYDEAVVEIKKFSELTVKVAEDSVAPITKQVSAAVDTLTKPLAA